MNEREEFMHASTAWLACEVGQVGQPTSRPRETHEEKPPPDLLAHLREWLRWAKKRLTLEETRGWYTISMSLRGGAHFKGR